MVGEPENSIPDSQKAQTTARDEYLRDAGPLIADLRSAGYKVEFIEDLTPSKNSASVVSILTKWLPKITNSSVTFSILRVLSQFKGEPHATEALLNQFKILPPDAKDGAKWAIANALNEIATEDFLTEILELVQDKRHGTARQMLVLALAKFNTPKVIKTLIKLLDDDDVAGHAVISLRKLNAIEAQPKILRLVNHPGAWIRKEAKQALAKFDR